MNKFPLRPKFDRRLTLGSEGKIIAQESDLPKNFDMLVIDPEVLSIRHPKILKIVVCPTEH